MKYSGFKTHLLKSATLYSFLAYTGNSRNLEGILCSYHKKVVSVTNGGSNSKAV